MYSLLKTKISRFNSTNYCREEREEIKEWFRNHYNVLPELIHKINNHNGDEEIYSYLGHYVQSEIKVVGLKDTLKRRTKKAGEDSGDDLRSNGVKRPKASQKARKKRKKARRRSKNQDESYSEDSEDDDSEENDDDNDKKEEEEVVTKKALLFRGFYSRMLYDMHGNVRSKYRLRNGIGNIWDENDFDDFEDSRINKKAREITSFGGVIEGRPKKYAKAHSLFRFSDDSTSLTYGRKKSLYAQEIAGNDLFPNTAPIVPAPTIGKIRRESPRVNLLMSSLSQETQKFLNRGKKAFDNKYKIDPDEDVYIDFKALYDIPLRLKQNDENGTIYDHTKIKKTRPVAEWIKSQVDKKEENQLSEPSQVNMEPENSTNGEDTKKSTQVEEEEKVKENAKFSASRDQEKNLTNIGDLTSIPGGTASSNILPILSTIFYRAVMDNQDHLAFNAFSAYIRHPDSSPIIAYRIAVQLLTRFKMIEIFEKVGWENWKFLAQHNKSLSEEERKAVQTKIANLDKSGEKWEDEAMLRWLVLSCITNFPATAESYIKGPISRQTFYNEQALLVKKNKQMARSKDKNNSASIITSTSSIYDQFLASDTPRIIELNLSLVILLLTRDSHSPFPDPPKPYGISSSNRHYYNNFHYAIKSLEESNASTLKISGYEEALEYLRELMVRSPYIHEPIFYLLRAIASMQLAYDCRNNEDDTKTSNRTIASSQHIGDGCKQIEIYLIKKSALKDKKDGINKSNNDDPNTEDNEWETIIERTGLPELTTEEDKIVKVKIISYENPLIFRKRIKALKTARQDAELTQELVISKGLVQSFNDFYPKQVFDTEMKVVDNLQYMLHHGIDFDFSYMINGKNSEEDEEEAGYIQGGFERILDVDWEKVVKEIQFGSDLNEDETSDDDSEDENPKQFETNKEEKEEGSSSSGSETDFNEPEEDDDEYDDEEAEEQEEEEEEEQEGQVDSVVEVEEQEQEEID